MSSNTNSGSGNNHPVHLMVRRKKTTIFLDAFEKTTMMDVKRKVAGILKIEPEDQRLYFNDELLDDHRFLVDYFIDANSAKAQSPATIGLAIRDTESGDPNKWEELVITPLSTPPELPDVMKAPDNEAH